MQPDCKSILLGSIHMCNPVVLRLGIIISSWHIPKVPIAVPLLQKWRPPRHPREIWRNRPQNKIKGFEKKGLYILIYIFFNSPCSMGIQKGVTKTQIPFQRQKPLLEVPNVTFLNGGIFLNNENLHSFNPSSTKPTHRKIPCFCWFAWRKIQPRPPQPQAQPHLLRLPRYLLCASNGPPFKRPTQITRRTWKPSLAVISQACKESGWHPGEVTHPYMGVSKSNGTPKSSILGYPYFWKHPYICLGTPPQKKKSI